MDLAEIWPPFGLRITTGDMELTPTREADLPELAEIARGGVRRDGVRAFLVDWDSGTDEEIGRSIAQYQWGTRANYSPVTGPSSSPSASTDASSACRGERHGLSEDAVGEDRVMAGAVRAGTRVRHPDAPCARDRLR